MVPAIVAAIAGVLGLVLGRFWDTHAEARRWRRDQRIRIYEQFASAYYASREAYRSVALLTPGNPEAEQAAARALDLGVDFNRASSRSGCTAPRRSPSRRTSWTSK